jgi:hypothetical protein
MLIILIGAAFILPRLEIKRRLILAYIAAPIATASSGFTDLLGTFPKKF